MQIEIFRRIVEANKSTILPWSGHHFPLRSWICHCESSADMNVTKHQCRSIQYEKFGGKIVDVLFQTVLLTFTLCKLNRPISAVDYLVKVVDWSKPRNTLLLFYLISTVLLGHTCNSPVMHLLFSLALKLLDQ